MIFQCRMGRRSALATQAFRAVGFDAYNMRGGIQAWAEKGCRSSPRAATSPSIDRVLTYCTPATRMASSRSS